MRLQHAILGALLFATLAQRAWAVGEVSGRLGGYVTVSATGDGLAGVKLTIRSKQLIGGPQTTTTNDDGSYIFQNLPPGSYEVAADIEGFTPVLQRGVTVNAGQQSSVDIKLEIQATPQVNQTYTIIEKRNPVLNPESAAAVTTFDNKALTDSPTFRQVQSVAQFTPGVGPGTDQARVRGGLGRYNKFLVDGLDTSDIVTGGISSPMNFDAVEEFVVSVGAMDAEYNSLGLVQNMVTRSGGNKFSVDASVIFQPTFVSASTRYPDSNAAGLQDGALLYDDRPRPQRDFYSVNLNIGGPIIKDKLWFYTSFQMNYNRATRPLIALPWHGINAPYDRYQDTYTYLGRAKLTWQATSSTRLALSFNIDRNYIRNFNSTNNAPEADRRIDRGGEWLVLLWDTVLSPKLLFQLQAGFTTKQALEDTIRTYNGEPDHLHAAHTLRTGDDFNLWTYLNSNLGWNNETKWNVQFSPTLLYTTQGLGGTHNIKGGMQLAYMRYDHNVGIAGGRNFTDTVPGLPCDPKDPRTFSSCNQVIDYPNSMPTAAGQAGPGWNTNASAVNIGFFLQDRFTFRRWLTIVPGMRIDTGLLYDYQGNQLATLLGFGPRLSLIYDLLHDRSTMIEAHYGRHNDVGNAFIADQGNPKQLSILKRWDPATQAFPDKGQISGGAGGQFFKPDTLAPPAVDEVSVGIHREVIPQAVVGVDYTFRQYSHLWINEETNQIWDPSGTRVVDYVNGQRQRIFYASTPGDAQRTYHGLDLWVKGNPGRWNLAASYTLAFLNGTVSDYFPIDGYYQNPRLNFLFNGPLPDVNRHYLKGLVDYTFPFGLGVGARLQYLSGGYLWKQFQSPQDFSYTLYRSPRGSDTGTRSNDPTTWAEFRLPDTFNLDLQLSFFLEHLTGQKIDLLAMLFNVLNVSPATAIQTRDGTTFGNVTSRPDPFFVEFVVRYRY